MPSPCRRTLLVLCCVVTLGFRPAVYAADSPAPPSERQIAQWIKELSADDFAAREKASRHLWLAGEAAEAALAKASQNGDPEAARRARDILEKFRWGIYGDTPAEVVALIRAYLSQDDGVNDEMVKKLLDSGIPGLRAILLIAKNDKNAERHKFFVDIVSRQMVRHLQKVFDKVEDKIRWDWFVNLAYESSCLGGNHFAAYWLLRGKLDDRIRDFRARLAKNPIDPLSAHTLVYLYRAKGELAEARKIAEKEKFDDLVVDILIKTADWKALAALPKPIGLSPIDQASYRASFARLSGNQKQFEAALANLKKLSHGQEAYDAGLTLIANDRPSEGIKLLAESEQDKHFAFSVLCACLQYREAMAMAEQPPSDGPGQKMLEIQQARVWYQLGEIDKGRALFASLGGQLAEGRNSYWSTRLLRMEHALGVSDLAFEHCARLLPLPQAKGSWSPRAIDFLSEIFPAKGADIWYPFLRRRFPGDSELKILHRLKDLFEGKIAKATVKAWIEEAQKDLDSVKESERGWHLSAFTQIAFSAGLNDLARSLLEKADPIESLLRLGDLRAGKQEWLRAAEYYHWAWKKNLPVEDWLGHGGVYCLPLYLAGDALVKAGREREGKRWIEQAHLAPLGDGVARDWFFEELRRRGHEEAAQRELTLAIRLMEANPLYGISSYEEVMYRVARASAARKDYFQAAQAYEQAMFRNLKSFQVSFGPVGVARVASEIHRLRACGLLAAGKDAEASRQIDLALIAWPANTEVANALVPELDRRGRKKEADALFQRCLEPHEKTCREYPRCVQSHNNAAWLLACCRRNLDAALQHAQKAVKLQPSNAGSFDTLAEVHFQRGEKDKAVAAVKRAIELDGKKSYYRKQLKRIQAGNPSAERPSENDEE